jgi:hypothetical protein
VLGFEADREILRRARVISQIVDGWCGLARPSDRPRRRLCWPTDSPAAQSFTNWLRVTASTCPSF